MDILRLIVIKLCEYFSAFVSLPLKKGYVSVLPQILIQKHIKTCCQKLFVNVLAQWHKLMSTSSNIKGFKFKKTHKNKTHCLMCFVGRDNTMIMHVDDLDYMSLYYFHITFSFFYTTCRGKVGFRFYDSELQYTTFKIYSRISLFIVLYTTWVNSN